MARRLRNSAEATTSLESAEPLGLSSSSGPPAPAAPTNQDEGDQQATRERTPRSERETVPVRMRPLYDEIVRQIDTVCRRALNAEYAAVCTTLAATLARKRPSPLTRGRPESWASGIVYAIGGVNFLFDKSQTPHLSSAELCALFEVSLATGSARGREIRKLFGMYQFDPRWSLPSRLEGNPYVWLLEVNGLLMDIRYAPREVQVDALRRGLIPFLPRTSAPS